jgi:Protein of unknown function (DUF3108)
VSLLPNRFPCNAATAAFAASVCALGALAADAIAHGAMAQVRLEANYTASIAGIPIGRGGWIIDITEDQYTAAASGGTTGILKFFSSARGTSAARGSFNGSGQPLATSYVANIDYDRRMDDVRIVLSGGNVTDYSAEPPLSPHADRIPVSDADRRGVVDPMSSTLNRVAGNGDPVSAEACGRKVAVFDGRVRYDLRSEFKRIEMVKAEKGYQGPAVVCAVYFAPISGFVPDRPVIKYLIDLRDAEVWLAPISGTRVLVPFRFAIPTPIGKGVLQATEFVSAPMPRAAVSVKTQ